MGYFYAAIIPRNSACNAASVSSHFNFNPRPRLVISHRHARVFDLRVVEPNYPGESIHAELVEVVPVRAAFRAEIQRN